MDTHPFIDLRKLHQAYCHSVRVFMLAEAIRLLSLFIIPTYAPALARPPAALSATEAVNSTLQNFS